MRKEKGRRGAVLSVSILSGVVCILAVQGLFDSFLSASVFRVQEIEVRWPGEMKREVERYRVNPPTSIFHTDLNAVARLLQKYNPAAEIEAVRRVLPNRIVATMRQRRALAQIKADRYYPVSEEGTIMTAGRGAPWPDLPVIYLEGVRGPFRIGEALNETEFWKAYELLGTVRRQGGLARHATSSIRCRADEIVMALDNGLELRFDARDVSAGWVRLAGIAAQKPGIFEQARYIDLRFEDPIIGGVKKPVKAKAKR